jgi:hypothetical protein
VQAKRSADAAQRNLEISELQEHRRRFGWQVTLHPNGAEYVLRNIGSVNATDVKLEDPKDFSLLKFVRPEDEGGLTIRPGESKAFAALQAFGRVGTEILIEWVTEGEQARRQWREVLPPRSSADFDRFKAEGAEQRERQRVESIEYAEETRSRLIDLATAYGEYLADKEDVTKKLRVQALVSALPANFVKEIGYEVDVPRDYWGKNQWPFSEFVHADRADDRALVDRDSATIELIWNLAAVQIPRRGGVGSSAALHPYYRIEHAVYGHIDLVRRREAGNRELQDSPEDEESQRRAQQMFAEMDRLKGVSDSVDDS